MLGREVRLPAEMVYEVKLMTREENHQLRRIRNIPSEIQHAHAIARKHLSASATRQKQQYDVKTNLNVQTR